MKIDLKQILKDEANWKHENFGIVASFISGLGEGGVVEYPKKPQRREIFCGMSDTYKDVDGVTRFKTKTPLDARVGV